MYMWDLDSYTKQMYELPWESPLAIDWVTEQRHYNESSSTRLVDPATKDRK